MVSDQVPVSDLRLDLLVAVITRVGFLGTENPDQSYSV